MENQENNERLSSLENTLSIINRITGGKDVKVIKHKTLEDGSIQMLEIQVTEADESGFVQQFDYIKKKDGSVILDDVWFNSEGMPVGGQTVAEFKGGDWRIVKE